MLNALVLVEDSTAAVAIEQLAIVTQQVQVLKSVDRLPGFRDMTRLIHTYQPDVVFLELQDNEASLSMATTIRDVNPHIAVIGVGASWMSRFAGMVSQAGVAVLLLTPVDEQGFNEAIRDAIRRTNRDELHNVVCLLPSKAGSGASTVALNLAGYMGASLDVPALLIEADLHSGLANEMLQVTISKPIRKVLAEAAYLDQVRWRNLVVQAKGIDLLATDRAGKDPVPTWIDYFHLLRFVSPRYGMVLVDLPEIINDATVETVRRARQVLVVTTPEVGHLKLAEQRLDELRARGIRGENVRIVLNRWHKTDLAPDEIAKLLGCPVAAVLRNDYLSVRKAQTEGRYIDPATQLGRSLLTFARSLCGVAEPPVEKSRLMQLLGR
ncbi:MAG: hypothetical protein ACKV22_37300 [Bryobacteraceae bacterium]